jgi:phospho-N-acetylmuramoyl-pentapeptide-transferase
VKTILLAAVAGLLCSILCTPLVVRFFRQHGFGQEIRNDGPPAHIVKRGTPTMGGVAIIGSTVFGYGVAHIPDIFGGGSPTFSGLLLLFVMVGLGTVGFLDDFIKIRRQRSLGLRARAKFGGQLLVAVVFGILALQRPNGLGFAPGSTHISFVRDIHPLAIGAVGFVILAYLIVAASANSVNLTDGLDGLAAGASAMVFGAYTLITFIQSRNSCGAVVKLAGCYEVRDPLDLAIVAAAAMSACFGFLWWNASPAQIFMGDTGSMALGGLMAALAILSKTELLLVVLGGLFAVVTLSGLIQAGWFKYTRRRYGRGRRAFKMSPIHHHFEMSGWNEVTIIVRFWIIAGLAVAFGMGLFYAEFIGHG